MNKYIELLMRYLVLECACVTSRTGKNGGIYEYVQCEFAYNSCRLEGGELSKKNVCNMYEHGIIYADEQEQIFRAEDIIAVTSCPLFNFDCPLSICATTSSISFMVVAFTSVSILSILKRTS